MDDALKLVKNKGFIAISMLIGLATNITFISLFVIHSKKYKDSIYCENLIHWDKALWISMIIYSTLSLLSNCIKLATDPDSSGAALTDSCLGCAGTALLVCWIGIQVVYFNLEEPLEGTAGVCGSLGKVNLAYIVTQYAMIGLIPLMCICGCICAACSGCSCDCFKSNNQYVLKQSI